MLFSEKSVATKTKFSFPDRGKSPVEYLSVFYSYPEWLVRKWIREWGVNFAEALLDSQNRIPTLTVRSNPLRADRAVAYHRLEAEKVFRGNQTPYSPQGIRLEDFRGRVDQGKAFQEGLFQVQDEAAQLTSILASPLQATPFWISVRVMAERRLILQNSWGIRVK